MKNWLFLAVVLVFGTSGQAATVTDTLHLNADTMSILGDLLHYRAFNSDTTFSRQNPSFKLQPGDVLDLTIFNHDTVDHTFTIDGMLTSNNTISAGGSNAFQVTFPNEGNYIYYSDTPQGRFIGASGSICVSELTVQTYFWHLHDLQATASQQLGEGTISALPSDYRPDFFFINGRVYPETLTDSIGQINASVGDSILVCITNSGNLRNSFHFHGYHVEILEAKVASHMHGWLKDTFPVAQDEAMTVLLVPHQPGEYPLHNHNLIAVTTSGFYPGGMITHINVAP